MVGESDALLRRRLNRRGLLGGSLAAGSAAVAYAALHGDRSARKTHDTDDTAAIARDEVKISHLLRRTGFGVTPDEYERYQSMGLEATLDELLHYERIDDGAAVAAASKVPVLPRGRGNAPGWWLTRIALTKRPLQEKMTFFWHNLFATQMEVVRDLRAMVGQNELFRRSALGVFPDLLHAISLDPAMLVFLNTAYSDRRAPNENYARELLELFAMGEGNYTEMDVREASRAFTGWRAPRVEEGPEYDTLLEPFFFEPRYDNGQKRFLGRSGRLSMDDVIDAIGDAPASATYITRRLFAYFVYPDPSAADIEPFVAVYNRERRIGDVVEAMLRSDVFYSSRAYRALVKSPVEYVVGALKALGTQARILDYLGAGLGLKESGGLLGSMGQVPFQPPDVAGWPGGSDWLNSSTMFARLNFVHLATSASEGGATDGRQASGGAGSQTLGSAAEALDYYLPLVLDDNIAPDARRLLLDHAGGAKAAITPEGLRGLVYLILASPQFHLS